ncbi:MAG TPA: hypothetical protein VJ476_04400 [Rhizomicrobium sp.]|nr:hypothetical protein [Rhizomicrobium sp.]
MITKSLASEHLAVDFGIVFHAWGSLGRALRAMPVLFVSGIVVTGLLTLGAWKFQAPYHALLAGAPYPDFVDFSYTLIVDFLDSMVLAAVAIPVHRQILLGERRDGLVPLLRARTMDFALWLVVLQMSAFAALLPLPLLMGASQARAMTIVGGMLLLLVVLFVVTVRLSLIFPAIAIDVPAHSPVGRAAAAWTLSRGHFWRVIVTLVFAVVPLLFLILLATVAANVLVGVPGATPVSVFDLLMWFEVVVTGLSRPLAAALASAVLSWNYKLAVDELKVR